MAAWQALAALQDGKAPPAPGAANSSYKRVGLGEPLTFESPAWRVELSNMTGAVVGLRFLGGAAAASAAVSHAPSDGGGGSSRDSGAARQSPWQPLLSRLALPGAARLLAADGSRAAALQQQQQQQQERRQAAEPPPSWAGYDSPLALPVYETFGEEDYSAIWHRYAYQAPDLQPWFLKDFGKPNATGARAAALPASLLCKPAGEGAAPGERGRQGFRAALLHG